MVIFQDRLRPLYQVSESKTKLVMRKSLVSNKKLPYITEYFSLINSERLKKSDKSWGHTCSPSRREIIFHSHGSVSVCTFLRMKGVFTVELLQRLWR